MKLKLKITVGARTGIRVEDEMTFDMAIPLSAEYFWTKLAEWIASHRSRVDASATASAKTLKDIDQDGLGASWWIVSVKPAAKSQTDFKQTRSFDTTGSIGFDAQLAVTAFTECVMDVCAQARWVGSSDNNG